MSAKPGGTRTLLFFNPDFVNCHDYAFITMYEDITIVSWI